MPNRDNESKAHVFSAQLTPLQVALWSGNREVLTSSGTTQRITLPTGATLLEIVSQEAVYLNFGGSGVLAVADDTSHLFLAGVQIVPVPLDGSGDPYTHVALIQESTAGIVQVEELT